MKKLTGLFLFIFLIVANASAFEFEGVSPIFLYGEWDKVKYYTNLTPSTDNYTLDLDQKNSGYIINTKRRIGLATGFVGRISEDLYSTSLISDIGLAPVVKNYASFVNHVDSMEEADKKIQFIPLSEEGLNEYKIGDSALFELVGGVVAHAGASSGVVHVGAKFLFAGGWTCFVTKISENQIYVELKKIKEINKSFYLNATIPYYENGIFKDNYHGFGYIIDYKTEEGMKAYKYFLRGQLDKIEEKENIITELKSLKSDKIAHIRGYGYGVPYIPFLNFSITKENSTTNESVVDLLDHETNNKYTLSLKRRDLSIFAYRKLVDTAFLISETAGVSEMQLFFKHATNFSRSNRITDTKESLIELTDLREFLDFKVKDEEKLGFAEIQFAINFGTTIKNAIKNKKDKFIELLSNEKFENNSDERIVKTMIKLIKKDKSTLTDLASFGQHFWNSKALFKFQYNLVSKCGGEMSYEVSGKRISRLFRKKVFDELESCPLK